MLALICKGLQELVSGMLIDIRLLPYFSQLTIPNLVYGVGMPNRRKKGGAMITS